ncbi:unnamed protein product [Prorocentrum cordatum]|uniref:Uncharacterized protein n=1 Tax=Prorocentrum cordatum TaxID=2364126 RepID=A0ABN9XBW5_9DINO|nr:unnamed protein product [Polarella glacialis]
MLGRAAAHVSSPPLPAPHQRTPQKRPRRARSGQGSCGGAQAAPGGSPDRPFLQSWALSMRLGLPLYGIEKMSGNLLVAEARSCQESPAVPSLALRVAGCPDPTREASR